MNEEYFKLINELSTFLNPNKYIVVGSVATLESTKFLGYTRNIHDLDVIVDISQKEKIVDYFTSRGYERKTFIDKRMPFYKSLMKESSDRYLRFQKDDIQAEFLVTEFKELNELIQFEIYPKISFLIPKENLIDKPFSMLDNNLKYIVMKVLNSSIGIIMRNKHKQRREDLEQLLKICNVKTHKEILSRCRIIIGTKYFKIPQILLN